MRYKLSLTRILSLRRGNRESGWIIWPVSIYLVLLWRSTLKTNEANGGVYWSKMRAEGNYLKTVIAAHLCLWKYIFAKAVYAATFGVFVFQKTFHAPVYAVNLVGQTTASFQDNVQQRFELWLDSQMDTIGEKVKELLKDPFMPLSLKNTIDDAVDLILPDLKLALFKKTDEYIKNRSPVNRFLVPVTSESKRKVRSLKRKNSALDVLDLDKVLDVLGDDKSGSETGSDTESEFSEGSTEALGPVAKRGGWKASDYTLNADVFREVAMGAVKVRAWILYTLSPYDKSFWENLHNPWYIALTLVGLVPTVGILWWIFLFVIHNKRDEYQLCQFIVGFQTAKFFSQGWFSLIRGAFSYYVCANKEIATCDIDGPRVSEYTDVLGFTFQIILVWLTFFILPYSEPCYQVEHEEHLYLLDLEGKNDRSRAALRAKVRLGRGGRLMHLFWYDTFTVFLIVALGSVAFFLGQRNWQLLTSFYWLRTIYGLLALPFVLFKLPIMGSLLTPTKGTGYNKYGKTVIKVVDHTKYSASSNESKPIYSSQKEAKLDLSGENTAEGNE